MNIDFNNIKNLIVSGTLTVGNNIVLWGGRGIEIIKSGTIAALPYLKDKRIAVASLIAVNLILLALGELFSGIILYPFPNKTEGQKSIRAIISLVIGLTTSISGVVVFSKNANLPLSPMVITGISAATLFFCIFVTGGAKNEPA